MMTKLQAETICTDKMRLIRETTNPCVSQLPIQLHGEVLTWAHGFRGLNPGAAPLLWSKSA